MRWKQRLKLTADWRSFPMKMKLPQDVIFHHDLRLMVFRPRGVLNEKRVDEIIAFLEREEERAETPFNRYSDLSKLQKIDLNFDYVVRVSLHRRLSYMKHAPVKSAFYVSTEEGAHLVNIHILMTDHSPLQVQMFEKVEDAAEWLKISSDNLRIGE
jgi:hypothetical protein